MAIALCLAMVRSAALEFLVLLTRPQLLLEKLVMFSLFTFVMFWWPAIVGVIIVILGVILFGVGLRRPLNAPLANPDRRRSVYIILGIVLIIAGGVGLILVLRRGARPPVGIPPPTEPPPFSISAIRPTADAIAPRNSVVQVFFNRAVRTSDLFINLVELTSDGNEVPVPSSVIAVNEEATSDGILLGRLVLRPITACEDKSVVVGCLAAEARYRVTVAGSKVHDLTGSETLRCDEKYPCTFTFSTNNIIDTTAPGLELPKALVLPARAGATIATKVSDQYGIAAVRLTIGRDPHTKSSLGFFPFDAGQTLLTVDTSKFSVPSHMWLVAEVFDVAGNRTVAERLVAFRASHCFNGERDENETGRDCGGPDCEVCAVEPSRSGPVEKNQPNEAATDSADRSQ